MRLPIQYPKRLSHSEPHVLNGVKPAKLPCRNCDQIADFKSRTLCKQMCQA